ncbi:MAG: NAD(P)-dependent oxidoreductase [Chloroflexota bacterium]|nr:NAD(P)-dependent oxidoreductase [Chloroflexota bacterium]
MANDGAIRRVGFLGVGSMGGPMAQNAALKGYEVHAYDPRPEALAALAEDGIGGCASAAEVARRTELVIAMPYDIVQVEQAVSGPAGLLEGWDGPGLLAVMSTVGPTGVRDLAGRLAERGHRLVDAPVSGGHHGAAAGTLTLMVGAAPADLERCRPVFETFAANVVHVGTEPGVGQAAKLINNQLVFVHHVAMAEALVLAARMGLDLRTVYDIVTTSFGNSVVFNHRVPAVLDRSFRSGGALNILVKDARLVLESAQATETPMFATAAAAQVFELARAMGLGDEDDVAVVKAFERILGQELGEMGPRGENSAGS